jgi:UDP-N-acetylmuramate-alanine ligase
MIDESGDTPFRYHLELTPQQLKLTHTALKSLLDDFGHDEPEIHKLIHGILDKLPDDHAIRAIQLDHEQSAAEEILAEPPTGEDEPPDAVA